MCSRKRGLLDLIRNFIVFEDDGEKVTKKLAGYHQFHAVNKAVETTLRAAGVAANPLIGSSGRESAPSNHSTENQSRLTSAATIKGEGDRRAGVIWHTQGSGKSLSMVFYAGKIVQQPEMENPTLVILTDRNDLDDQLFGTFARCHELLRQKPVQAENRENLKKLLAVASGGVVFTTIRNSFPRKRAANIRCFPTGETLSSSPTKRTAANTISLTASRVICATHCRTRHSRLHRHAD